MLILHSNFPLNYILVVRLLLSYPTLRSSDLAWVRRGKGLIGIGETLRITTSGRSRLAEADAAFADLAARAEVRSEEHTSELQSRGHLVCRLLHANKIKRMIKYEYILT